jgi:imidazolonepropionase-like amidohydrolase
MFKVGNGSYEVSILMKLLLKAFITCTLSVLALTTSSLLAKEIDNDSVTVIKAGRILDGRGNLIGAREIVVRGNKIESIQNPGTTVGDIILDWSGYTVMPGIIDTHVHLGWHFGSDGKWDINANLEDHVLYALDNAYKMAQVGVTTVQSLGGPEDKPVREALKRGIVPGPRVLSSLGALFAQTGDPAAMRMRVNELADEGADVIKIFGSESIRTGGGPNLSSEQLEAACGEAHKRGLRAVVHAHGPEAARRASEAGCNGIEHGALLDQKTLKILAKNDTYYAPHTHLIFQNYFDNKERYSGIGNFNAAGFEALAEAVPKSLQAFKIALSVPGLKILYGTDAVAGAHGRNMEELIYRVQIGGQDPMQALVSAHSLAAKSLGMDDQIGTLTSGFLADIVAVEGNPEQDIEALKKVRAVMINGQVIRQLN